MNYYLIWPVYACSLGVALVAVFRDRRNLPVLFSAAVPWFGLQVNMGLTVNLDRALAILMVVGVVVRKPALLRYVLPFLAYAVFDTVAQSADLPLAVQDYPLLQGEYRWVFQLIMWTLLVAPVAYFALDATDELVRKIYSALTLSIAILALLGIIQYVVYFATGHDIFPVGLLQAPGGTRTGVMESYETFMGGHRSMRASALAGEPKHLAYTCAVGLTILAADYLGAGGVIRWARKRVALAAGAMAIALVLTFSTQGFLLLGVNLMVMMCGALLLFGAAERVKRYARLVAIASVVALVVAAIPGLADVLLGRTVGRIENTGLVEDWNRAVLDWLLANPTSGVFGVGLGNVHFYAYPFIPVDALDYMRGQVFVAKAGGLRLLSELGVVGLLAFCLSYLVPYLHVFRAARRTARPSVVRGPSLAATHALVGGALLADYLLSADGPPYVFVFWGLSVALSRIAASGPRASVPGVPS